MARARIICLHRQNGRVVCFHIGKDRAVPLTKPVVVIIGREKIEVRESKREIDALIKDA